jgi:hypothetical protein
MTARASGHIKAHSFGKKMSPGTDEQAFLGIGMGMGRIATAWSPKIILNLYLSSSICDSYQELFRVNRSVRRKIQ